MNDAAAAKAARRKGLETLIRHEIGHWIAARRHGIHVGDIGTRLGTKAGHWAPGGSCHLEPRPGLWSLQIVDEYLVKRIAVLQAGALNQSSYDRKNPPEVWNQNGEDDYGKILDLGFILRGIRHPSEPTPEDDLAQTNIFLLEIEQPVQGVQPQSVPPNRAGCALAQSRRPNLALPHDCGAHSPA